MQFGLFYECVVPAMKNDGKDEATFLAELKARGMDYLEAHWNVIRSKPASFFEMLRELEIGLSVYVRVTPDGLLLEGRTPLAEELDRLVELGIRDVMVIPHAVDGEDSRSVDVFERSVSSVAELVKLARERGLKPTFEDYDSCDMPCGSCRDMLAYSERIPELGFTLDTGNFQLHGEDVLDCLPKLIAKVTHVHVKDRLTFEPDSPATFTGEGVLPLREVLAELKRYGYNDRLTAETFQIPYSGENLARCLEFVIGAVK